MPDIVYVSNEADLKSSLPGEHQVTVIKADYVSAIFDGYKIKYCFNETLKPGNGKLYTLKHIFIPETSTDVIFKSDTYGKLLKKIIDRNHSVAFILSITNVELLRLCECFIDALYYKNDEKTISTPHVIGKAKIPPGIFVPVWSSFWPLETKNLSDVLINAFAGVLGSLYYSEEGFNRLLALLKEQISKITGGSKIRIHQPSMRCHFRQNIEGPHEMLDTSEFVKKIESIATEVSELLKPYELKAPQHMMPSSRKACDAVKQLLPMIFEYPHRDMAEQEMITFCENASGELIFLTPEAIEQRSREFGDDNRSDDLGNIYSFLYKVYDAPDSGSIIVCPEGREDLFTELYGVPAESSEEDVTINVLEVTQNNKVKIKVKIKETENNKVKIKIPGQEHTRSIESNKLLMFMIIYYFSIYGQGIGYLSKKSRLVNKEVFPLVGYDKEEKAMPLCQKVYPISGESEYSQHFIRLISKVLTGMEVPKDKELLGKYWLKTDKRSNFTDGEANYSRGALYSIRLVISSDVIDRLKQTKAGNLLSKTEWEKLETLEVKKNSHPNGDSADNNQIRGIGQLPRA